MKPDWKDAPEWANWFAMEATGVWYWFENKPFPDFGCWYNKDGKFKPVYQNVWNESLTERPSDTK